MSALKARVVRSEFQLDSKRDFFDFDYYNDNTGTVRMYWQNKGTEKQRYPPTSAERHQGRTGGIRGVQSGLLFLRGKPSGNYDAG